MLFATQSKSIAGTQRYFQEVLTRGDYYVGQEIAGHWHGRGAELLGVGQGSEVTPEQFNALLEGNHPTTDERLTQRVRQDRRPGMDLTFSVPKSVSLAWAINDDERILNLLRDAVLETMAADVEPLMQRRVRQGKHATTKQKTPTGKLIYADFLHKTSRPVEGVADPHLHVHAFVVNWTEDQGKHYAGEMEEIVRQRPSLQAKFHARLARKLQQLGYGVENVQYQQSQQLKRGWEITGIPRPTIEKFSRRTAQVEQHAAEHGIEDAQQKGQLGKLTREKKDAGRSIAELRADWRGRLTATERAAFANLTTENQQGEGESETDRANASVKYALEHHLYRQSTVERHQVVGAALEHGVTLRPQDVERAIDTMGLIERQIDVQGSQRTLLTTRAVLEAERQMIGFAREGRGTRRAIKTTEHSFERDWLNEHQKNAVQYVLQSRDTVMAIMGRAGTGKTSLMQEAVEAIRGQGKQVHTFAPSTGAREVLEKKGFAAAQTVEHLIRNTSLHPQLKDQVLWIDEAGLLDVRSMNAVFHIAQQQNARVVLSGDTRQHASPRQGEAMRLLEKEAGLKLARTEKIQRQQGKYRQAVALISKGYEVVDQRSGMTGLLAGFDLLDAMGKIKEIAAEDRHAEIAKTYLQAEQSGKSTLIVAPTHAEGAAATAEIRTQLQSEGKLSTKEKSFTQYQSLNLSAAEKSDARSYADPTGVIVQFHQNAKEGIRRGDRFRVLRASDGKVELAAVNGSQRVSLPLSTPDRFEVYRETELRIAAGDKIRFSLGGKTQDKKGRLSNGRLDEVKGFDRRGNLILKNGWVVDKSYGHLDLGYVITSHASQGKDRDLTIAAMGSQSLPAINARQFYVTVSRGREDVVLFVDDKSQVRRAIQRSGEQLSATEMVQSPGPTATRETRDDLARAGRNMIGSFRNRLLRWWRGLGRQAGDRQPVDRQRAATAGRELGLGLTPSMERSR